MSKRVKDKSEVEAKMKLRVAGSGQFLKAGMEKADDPIDVALADIDNHTDKMVKGVARAKVDGSIKAGLEKAKDRNAWKKSIDRAASHFEERTEDMVANSLDDYDKRKACIEEAKGKTDDMPKTTRAQSIQKSAAYQTAVGECFDKIYGRKR